jgi:hypothetical protein
MSGQICHLRAGDDWWQVSRRPEAAGGRVVGVRVGWRAQTSWPS